MSWVYGAFLTGKEVRNGFDKPPLDKACWSTAPGVQVTVPSALCCHPCGLCGAVGHNHAPPFVLGQASVVPKIQ